MLSPAPRIVSLTASNPSTASGDISFYSDGCKMTIQFDISTDTGEWSSFAAHVIAYFILSFFHEMCAAAGLGTSTLLDKSDTDSLFSFSVSLGSGLFCFALYWRIAHSLSNRLCGSMDFNNYIRHHCRRLARGCSSTGEKSSEEVKIRYSLGNSIYKWVWPCWTKRFLLKSSNSQFDFDC